MLVLAVIYNQTVRISRRYRDDGEGKKSSDQLRKTDQGDCCHKWKREDVGKATTGGEDGKGATENETRSTRGDRRLILSGRIWDRR